ncbi:LysR family transcriptional regulator [Veronia nyctiphanis]|uniref:LysR family transcriptional regulator n=1 Tax=Veronia nyctiphanis TaxID=1278244 RepID=A0A4Q0YMB2_9GAMM|nr:LysR family transcriptional regulator [Veronia nyctiphanis]RXJ71982.1 LysR family transcriptional regulator [Veronia nyctiphanis]
MSIKIQQLVHFSLVAEMGGFRAAASRANRTQAALSTSVKELERILGQSLFQSGHKAQLTPFGQYCLPKVKVILKIYDDFDTDLKAAASGETGVVRIASVPSVAAKLIPSVLAEFTNRFPNVHVSLIDDNAAGVEAKLLAGEVDLALGNCLHMNDDDFLFEPLLSDPVGVVCTNDHPILADNRRAIRWEDIAEYPFIRNGTCSLLSNTPAALLAEKALYSVENITSLFSLLEHGVGITTLPRLAFSDKTENLCWLPLDSPYVERQIGVFTLRGRYTSAQASNFSELCVSMLKAH